MKSLYIYLCLAFFGIAVGYGRRQQPNRGIDRRRYRERKPQLSALDRMLNVTTMDEFLELLTTQGRPATEQDIYSKYPSQSGQRIAAQGGYMAEPDQCSPREMTIDLDIENPERDMVYFPRCTKIARCGGCCSSPHVTCEPVETARSSLNVVKGQVPFPGSDHLVFSGFQKVPVVRHLSCRLQCNLSQEKCGPRKIFLPHQCACTCAKSKRCLGFKRWDPETCDCVCARTRKCLKGQVFSQSSCGCEKDLGRHEISHDGASSASDMRKYLDQRQRARDVRDHNVKKSPPLPAIPTTIATEASREVASTVTKEEGGCASVINCPPEFIAVQKSAMCVCDPVPGSPYFRNRQRNVRKNGWWQKRRRGNRRRQTRKQTRRGR